MSNEARSAFVIHGAYGSPSENWFRWLADELEGLGIETYVPEFPTPEEQNLENWMDVFEDYRQYVDDNTIIIGHSLGPAFILNVLELPSIEIDAAFFVSGFTGLLGDPQFDDINETITNRQFDFEEIRDSCEQFYLYHGDDDPYVPMEKAERLAEACDGELKVVSGAGHFNEDAGYTEFQRLFDDIEAHLQSENDE